MCTWLWMTGEELGPFEFLSVSVLNQLEENVSTTVNPETTLTGLGEFGQWPMGGAGFRALLCVILGILTAAY